jgi:hypothetical protein
MHPTFFKAAAKRVTKLTDKAKVAIDEKLETSSKKQKNDNASVMAHAKPKKTKSAQEHGNNVEEAPPKEPIQYPAHGSTIKQAPPKVHQGVVLSDGEDTFNDEAILISDGENDARKGTITDGDEESAKDELSKRPRLSSKYQLMLATAERLMKEWNSPLYAFFDPCHIPFLKPYSSGPVKPGPSLDFIASSPH